mmetsp:Transcript_53664/g.61510  ORF Transcript_53664/g.61510 Transcript_53664/m.61510 type:complete len:114 (+) Transcript_53664:40-381(+)
MSDLNTALGDQEWSLDEQYKWLIQGAKGHDVCADERKIFNLCRANPIGSVIDPEICLTKAENFHNCFNNKVTQKDSTECKAKFDQVMKCAKTNDGKWFSSGACQEIFNTYSRC